MAHKMHLIDRSGRYVGSAEIGPLNVRFTDPVQYNGTTYAANGSVVGSDWIMREVAPRHLTHEHVQWDDKAAKLLKML